MNLRHETVATDAVYAQALDVAVYTIPTSSPESDGTLEWESTTLVLATIHAGDKEGLGYTYASSAAAEVISKILKPLVVGENAMNIPALHRNMMQAIRNQGNCGIAMMALSAVDIALWDLKARLLDVPLTEVFGRVREQALIYGSGGFTSYSPAQLQRQLGAWAEEGMRHVKMKIGRDISLDAQRVAQAREAIGDEVGLFVDANGAYTVKQAIEKAAQFADENISWFEEPVIAEDHAGLRFIREHVPANVNIAGGEYGYHLPYFKEMLQDETVDVLQADATRCGGITGFLKAGYLAEAYSKPFSSHCAPTVHLAAAMSLPSFYIAEYFHDHARVESMLFDGFIQPTHGYLYPDLSRPGLGIDFKYEDAAEYKQ